MSNDQDEAILENEARLAREVRRGLDQLDRGEQASFDAERIIIEERTRLVNRKVGQ